MEQPFGKFLAFKNRLAKVYRHTSKSARRQGVSCYRIYNHDLPEAPFIIEVFEDKIYVSEYKRQHKLTEEEYEAWLAASLQSIAEVTGVPEENIYTKLRQRKAGHEGQYQKLAEEKTEFPVAEGGLKFLVNLTDYLDTGLFLDHRITRGMVKEASAGKKVLNLFCYTGSFSVYAAAGGATEITSVDLSNTYLSWAERNMALNFPDKDFLFVHADVVQYLEKIGPAQYDLIVMDPPTFSNSKRMTGMLDIQRDHVTLINHCLRALTPGGKLFFSTNFSKFVLKEKPIATKQIKDITRATTPFDFEGKLQRQCWLITK